ncbi:glycosyltransferase [Roseibium sediminicola]|uniref:Glycosyltransferase n=1 Tax=Roseibium sediminicola TaxID=2933272 RepID=A0ABT0H577_9HYPH|nr:glycosyltransferase [Roseibium sp. CAU 1639]MCK7616243.1 glycosyltransferase [Roseibium sp. CAU 1639]
MPKVTICTPTKNAESTIERTANSVLSQTYDDWTMLVLDNGSTDNSIDILDRLFRKAGRQEKLKVFSDENLNLSEARHFLSSTGDSEYIAVLDADDQFRPDKLERQLWIMDKESDISLCGSAAIWFREHKLGRLNYDEVIRTFRPAQYQYPRLDTFNLVHASIPHSSFFMRRADYEKVGGYRPYHHVTHDHDLMLRLSDIGLVFCDKEPLIRYLVHDNAISALKRRDQVQNAIVSYANLFLRRINEPELTEVIPEEEVFIYLKNIGRAKEAKTLRLFFEQYLKSMMRKRHTNISKISRINSIKNLTIKC